MEKVNIIEDIKQKLDNIDKNYAELLRMYENQIKTNQNLKVEIDELKQLPNFKENCSYSLKLKKWKIGRIT